MPSSFTRTAWAADLLGRMRLPRTQSNMVALVAWQRAEGGHFKNSARFNPLNTTQPAPGSSVMNSHGVRRYRSYESGMNATIDTLRLGYYGGVRAALRQGRSASAVANAVVDSKWGTKELILEVLPDARREVASDKSWPKGAGRQRRDQGRGVPLGGERRVLIDPAELSGLADALSDAHDLAATVDRRARHLAAGLDLDVGVLAPDEAGARKLRSVLEELTDPTRGLPHLLCGLADDERYVRSVRRKALAADAGGPVTSAEQTAAVLAALAGKLPPATLAVIEAILLGGLRLARGLGWRSPASPGPRRPPAVAAPGNGSRPERPSRQAKVRKVVKLAEGEVGTREAGDNVQKYGRWYGMNGQPWCAMFVSWVFAKAGAPLPALQSPKGFAYVPTADEAFKKRGQFHKKPRVGDVWLVHGGSYPAGHTGIVVKVEPNGDFWTVEGNANDAVRKVRHRKTEPGLQGFARVL